MNISQNSAVGSKHRRGSSHPNICPYNGQGLTTNHLSSKNPSQEENAQSSMPQVGPAPRSHAAEDFGTSVYTSGQVPEYSSLAYLMPIPSITSEVKKSWELMSTPTSVKSVGSSRRNAKPNDDSRAFPLHCQCLAISQSHNTVCL